MSRPPATIVDQIQIGDFVVTVAETESNYEVVRYNKPVYMIKQHWLQDRKTYPRISFSNEAHAQNLANKLNVMFNTQAYTVRRT